LDLGQRKNALAPAEALAKKSDSFARAYGDESQAGTGIFLILSPLTRLAFAPAISFFGSLSISSTQFPTSIFVSMSRGIIAFAAILEALVGVALMIAPIFFVNLLFGETVFGAGLALARLAGSCYVSLGIACLPLPVIRLPALRGLLAYNLLAAFFVGYLWFAHQLVGKLLLPAFVLHAVLSFLLVWV
jgi:hypothetical protein